MKRKSMHKIQRKQRKQDDKEIIEGMKDKDIDLYVETYTINLIRSLRHAGKD